MNVTTNAITVHTDGTVSHAAGLRARSIPAAIWRSLTEQERRRVLTRLRGQALTVTITGRGDLFVDHYERCGLTSQQARMLMRASRAALRKVVAA
jgi:hypothetical protein